MPLIHDVMPIIHPEWFNSEHIKVFSDWLSAHLRHSDRFLTNSHRTAEDLAKVAPSLGVDRALDIVPVPLGADYPVTEPTAVELPDGMDRYLLVVGTLEPRKNQRIVLDAFDRLRGAHPDLGLVLVGKEGWLVDDLVRRIRNHPELDRRLLWLGGIDDAQLAWLYANAFLTVTPSQYEGLGVPLMEALDRGCATLSSTGGALPEAAQGAAEMFEPDDLDELTRLISLHLDDPEHHRRAIERAGVLQPHVDDDRHRRRHRDPPPGHRPRRCRPVVSEVGHDERRPLPRRHIRVRDPRRRRSVDGACGRPPAGRRHRGGGGRRHRAALPAALGAVARRGADGQHLDPAPRRHRRCAQA